MREFLSFETFITPRLIRVVFVIGLVLLVLGTVLRIVAMVPDEGIIGGLVIPLIGMLVAGLLWRIYCEIILVFFDIRDKVAAIEHRPLS